MDATTVYAKTELGHEEVATRVRHVPARLRAMLIMVDGRRSVGALVEHHPAPDEARGYLQTLVEGGFIAPAGGSESAVAPPSADAPVLSDADLTTIKQDIARILIDFLGPDADLFTARVEKLNARDELMHEARRLHQMLEDAFGHARAERFRAAIFPLLE